jgi:hypothetical protein
MTTPLQVSEKLHEYSDKALSIIDSINPENNTELAIILNDIRAMALLGKYYAFKISGSVNVALSRETKDEKYRKEAVNQLTEALNTWKLYTRIAMEQNINPIWTNRVGYVDWVKFTQYVEHDIEIAETD